MFVLKIKRKERYEIKRKGEIAWGPGRRGKRKRGESRRDYDCNVLDNNSAGIPRAGGKVLRTFSSCNCLCFSDESASAT